MMTMYNAVIIGCKIKVVPAVGNKVTDNTKIYLFLTLHYLAQMTFAYCTCTVATASTAPAAPSRWPIIDFVELTRNCIK